MGRRRRKKKDGYGSTGRGTYEVMRGNGDSGPGAVLNIYYCSKGSVQSGAVSYSMFSPQTSRFRPESAGDGALPGVLNFHMDLCYFVPQDIYQLETDSANTLVVPSYSLL